MGESVMMTYENWIKSCPDPVRFATNYVDIESDVLSVIDTYDRDCLLYTSDAADD